MVIALRCHFVPRSTVYARTSRLRRRVTDCYYFPPRHFPLSMLLKCKKGKKRERKEGKKREGAPDNLERSMLVNRAPGNFDVRIEAVITNGLTGYESIIIAYT